MKREEKMKTKKENVNCKERCTDYEKEKGKLIVRNKRTSKKDKGNFHPQGWRQGEGVKFNSFGFSNNESARKCQQRLV